MRSTQHPRSGARAGILAALALGIPLGLAGLPAQAVTPAGDGRGQDGAPGLVKKDDRPGPLTKKTERNRLKAVTLLRNGAAELQPQPGGGATVKLANGEFVEFPVEKTDKVWTVLSQFGTTGSGRFGRTPGPLHNEIPAPDRTADNSTVWTQDFDRAHYDEMFNGSGESFKDYYTQLSSGRYTAVNTVEDWVTVPGNASAYGDNAIEDDGGSWAFIGDTVDAWYSGQVAAGKSAAEIDAYLAQFDEWDRYDFDGDGDFTEADGYIDHFQAVHAGEGEEAGADPDAIWSHRWYVDSDLFGQAGPTVGGQANLLGGTQIGQSRYFIGDYTVEPENGGLGVFAHEFGHDLGLPDFYDTAGGENGTSFWTLMSSGSWLGHGGQDEGIGTTPGLMGPEEKLFLGWLDYETVGLGETKQVTLSPSQGTYTGQRQAIQVELPPSERTAEYTTPPAGTHAWWSGRGDGLNNTLTRQVPAASSVTVSAQLWHQIEAGYDYLYAEWSTDGGKTWRSAGSPIDGASKGWTSTKWSYKPGGAASLFRFRYATDGGVNEAGAFLDSITVTAGKTVVVSDGAEAGPGAWDVKGWAISTGTETTNSTRYYLLENRQYVGYDSTLETGPYNFSEGVTRPNWVEHFAFRPGMLVWLVDQGLADNNTSAHPGEGYALPVDARPEPFTYPDGTRPSNRRQPFDATFGLDAVPRTCLHKQDASGARLEACAESAAMPVFDDSDPEAYWSDANPQSSVQVAGHGVKATVLSQSGTSLVVEVVNPS